MQYYGQTDSRWGNFILGYNSDPLFNIRNYGCLVTAWANLMIGATGDEGYDPGMVNKWLQQNNGFLKGGGIFRWDVALTMGHVTYVRTTADMADMVNFLVAPPNFAIVEVRNLSGGQHFVFANLENSIIDSEDGKQKAINTIKALCGPYPFVQAHLYTATNPPVGNPSETAAGPAQPVYNGVAYTPVDATVTIAAPKLNARQYPRATADSPVLGTFRAGTAHIRGWAVGQKVTVAATGRTDDVWLLDDNGHWFAQAGTTANE